MAKRKRRNKNRHAGRNWVISIPATIVIFLSVYIGYHSYRTWNQQRIGREAREKDRRAKQLFIQQVAPEAQAMQNTYHVYASITIVQAVLESQWGTNQLASQYHNLFGIKGTGANSRIMITEEYISSKRIVTKGRFHVYDSWSDFIKDHTRLMLNGTGTNQQNYGRVVHATNYQEAARGLQEAGYATDPGYARKLTSVIKACKLYNYDK